MQSIVEGLRGTTITDEAGKNKQDSRTPTGLRHPSLTDNAQAWCALFGVSAFPVMKGVSARRGATASLFQLPRYGSYAILPVWLQPWTLQKYRSVVRSQALLIVGIEAVLGNDDKDDAVREKDDGMLKRIGANNAAISLSRQWLNGKGVEYAMLFPQYVSSNSSAPERWLKKGELVLLDSEKTDYER